jgi:hypothetical protein
MNQPVEVGRVELLFGFERDFGPVTLPQAQQHDDNIQDRKSMKGTCDKSSALRILPCDFPNLADKTCKQVYIHVQHG